MKYLVILLAGVALIAGVFYFTIEKSDLKPETVVKHKTEISETASPKDVEALHTARKKEIGDFVKVVNKCIVKEDCIAVFPCCCGTAMPPYFINGAQKDNFIRTYKKIFREPEVCPQPQKCPRSYYGGAKADCINDTCVEAVIEQAAPQQDEDNDKVAAVKAAAPTPAKKKAAKKEAAPIVEKEGKKTYPVLIDEPKDNLISLDD